MTDTPRGSEWRKWDLHIHAPGTKLNNQYTTQDWVDYCQTIEQSDVAAVGITDYFSFDGFFAFTARFRDQFPDSRKLILPNLELRLNESVNGASELVDFHILFRPDLDAETANRFLQALKTQLRANDRGLYLSCLELRSAQQYTTASVTRDAIQTAIAETFGSNGDRSEDVVLLVPANGNGIRPLKSQQRKLILADNIDAFTDAIFGTDRDSRHFMRRDRFEDGYGLSAPKPVFGGSDAHSMREIREWLGKSVEDGPARKVVTWVKADPTFEGLRQALVEPDERVRIAPTRPDAKEPYKWISKVRFESREFPPEIRLNQNLVSIIGSRSSGKSSLLAYISHSIDQDYTVDQQIAAASGSLKRDDAGPAAGKTWTEVGDVGCSVEWADGSSGTGQVIYIPQNSLFSLSERPDDVTAKIQPALYRLGSEYQAAHERALRVVSTANAAIATSVAEWFAAHERETASDRRLRALGDRAAVEAVRDGLSAEIREKQAASSLSEQEVQRYGDVMSRVGQIASRIKTIDADLSALEPYVISGPHGMQATDEVAVEIRTTPSPTDLPTAVSRRINALLDDIRAEALEALVRSLEVGRRELENEKQELKEERFRLETDHALLIEKARASTAFKALVERLQTQERVLDAIRTEEESRAGYRKTKRLAVEAINSHLTTRSLASSDLAGVFADRPPVLDGTEFGFDERIAAEALAVASDRLNRLERSKFLKPDVRMLDLDAVHDDVQGFLTAVASGEQKLKQGTEPAKAAVDVLTLAPSVRFYAVLDGDRIGGFERSSMTPGKQALFALTLTLSESDEPWPLLIDQPEDDLDSRSIYDVIVPYLKARKRERQILMVTHNANLVIGADSEQVVIANRHGDDRPNREQRTFDCCTGSLEHTMPVRDDIPEVLWQCGVREHACQILDGGEEAFQKRRDKYRI